MKASRLTGATRRLVADDSPRRFVLWSGGLGILLTVALLVSCGRSTRSVSPDVAMSEEDGSDRAAESTRRRFYRAPDRPWPNPADDPETPGETVILVGAGDIADGADGDEQTAKLLDQIPGLVFTTGDNAYSNGTAAEYRSYYDPTWGRHKARTRPTPGNHEYNTSGASGYYDYFGELAGPGRRGYYSYDYGEWHIVSLNSNIDMSAGSAQERWLRADLAANPTECTLAYWHHPRFSSGEHGNSTISQDAWQALQDAGAEIVVVGHDHNYERFAPMTATGQKDLERGIRSFVVGTGGRSLRDVGTAANAEAKNSTVHGVIKFTLGPGAYQWEFIPVAGRTYRDAGSGTCH